MSLDLRTRVDGAVEAIDAREFFDDTMPTALAACDADGIASLRLRTLVVSVEGRQWTLLDESGTVSIRPGDQSDGAARRARVRLSPAQLSDLANDLVTPVGLLSSGQLEMDEGQVGHLLDWWLVLRSALDRVPIHQPGMVSLPDSLDRVFTLADDVAEMSDFLATAGFLHIAGVFDRGEMSQVSDDMDAAAPSYSQGDGNSWWAGLRDGRDVLVRMQQFDRHSEATSALLDDSRFVALADLGRSGHVLVGREQNRIEALFKPLGVVQGISDVPWHKDCSLGRHSYECCSVTVGISVTGGGPTSGQLRVIAGSHRALIWPSLVDPTRLDLPDVALATEAGDVTIHLSCTMHMAQPPTERERRVMYTDFKLPPPDPAATAAARAHMRSTIREQAPLRLSQPAAPPQTDRKSPQTDRNSPQTDRNSPQTDRNSPQTDRNSPQTDRNSPQTDRNSMVNRQPSA